MKAIHICGMVVLTAAIIVTPLFRPPLQTGALSVERLAPDQHTGQERVSHADIPISADKFGETARELDTLSGQARAFAEKNPREGVRHAAGISDPETRRIFLNALFRRWGELHGSEALQFAIRLAGELHGVRPRDLLASAAYGWSGHSPQAAAEWIAEHLTTASPSHCADTVLAGVVLLWAEKDPTASLAWLTGRSGLPNDQTLYNSVGFAWAGADLAEALARASGAPAESPERLGLLSGALRKWSQDSPSEATQWMTTQLSNSDLTLLRDTVRIAAIHLSDSDRPAALSWAASMPDRTLRSEAVTDLVHPWIHDTPTEAMTALQTTRLPAEERLEVLGTSVKHWSHLDPVATSDWIEQQPAGSEKDRAISEFIETVASEEPAAAATWAASIGDATKRNDSLLVVTREWMRVAPEQCVAWFEARQKELGPELVATVHRLVLQR